ncbi:hypothetical protein ACLOJK_022275 [Asimina triloba]
MRPVPRLLGSHILKLKMSMPPEHRQQQQQASSTVSGCIKPVQEEATSLASIPSGSSRCDQGGNPSTPDPASAALSSASVRPPRSASTQALAALRVRCLPATGDLHQRPSTCRRHLASGRNVRPVSDGSACPDR